jgi:hypothetical protein
VLFGTWIELGRRSDPILSARRCVYFYSFAWAVLFSIAIPNALKLSELVGGDATMSGWIISGVMLGAGNGAIVVWATNYVIVDGTLTQMRGFSVLAGCLTSLGTVAYAVMAWWPRNAWSFVVARYVAGFGLGISTIAGRHFINRTARGTEIKEVHPCAALWIAFGFGVGPLMQVGLNGIFYGVCGSYPPRGKGAEYQGSVGFAICCLIFAWSFPTTDQLELSGRLPKQLQRTETDSSSRPYPHKLTIFACLPICGLRGFSMASLEAATSMLLEEKFGLKESAIGLLISLTFLFTVPVKLLFDTSQRTTQRKDRHAITLRGLMLISILGCILLREDVGVFFAGESNPGKIAVIIFADMLLFPAIFLSGAIVEALAMRLASPEGTFFSTNNIIAMYNVATTTLGRGLGPPTARTVLGRASGQTAYSWQQLVMCSISLLLIELAVVGKLPFLDKEFGDNILTPVTSTEDVSASEAG